MSFDVLVYELAHKVSNESHEANHFVVGFSMMNEFVANDAADRAEEACDENEAEVIRVCLRLLKVE